MVRGDLMSCAVARRAKCGAYREFRPYLNEHPCGTPIADLVDVYWFRCWQARRSLKTGSPCLAQSSSASKCREFVPRKNSVLDQPKFGRVDPGDGEAAFPLRKANVDATGLLRLSGESQVAVV
jgi:hypothetical protein